jgi:hypothetical protein
LPSNDLWPPAWQMQKPNMELPYENRTGSVPADSYQRAFWASSDCEVVWLDPLAYSEFYGPLDRVVGGGFRGLWRSTILDFRPDLRGAMSAPPIATPIRGAGYGLAIELAIKVNYSEVTIPFRVFALEYAALTDPTQMQRVANVQDVTTDFYDAQVNGDGSTVILTFRPTTSTRYWRTALIFDALTDLGPVDPLTLPRVSIASTSW